MSILTVPSLFLISNLFRVVFWLTLESWVWAGFSHCHCCCCTSSLSFSERCFLPFLLSEAFSLCLRAARFRTQEMQLLLLHHSSRCRGILEHKPLWPISLVTPP